MSVNSPDASLKAAPRVRVECEHCGKGHWVAAENAGRKTLCKKCGALFRIPDGETMSGRSESAAICAVGLVTTPHPPRSIWMSSDSMMSHLRR